MTAVISDELLFRFGEVILCETGLCFSHRGGDDLRRRIERASRDFGYEDPEACIRWLMSAPLTRDKVMVLATHLTTGETYFFREPQVFTILENRILRELIDSRRGINQRLNIWCAACSTGEEPYSVAMLIKKLVGDIKEWDITIMATDINPDFLKKASEGVYGQWSFRNTPTWAVDRYFKKSGVRHEIIPEIRQMVNFSYLNLVRDPYPCLLDADKMDIIFCRNVFIYFDQDNRDKVIQRFYHCLGNGGWLIIGIADAPPGIASGFRAVNCDGLSLYRKDNPGHGSAGVLSAAFQFPTATDYVAGIMPGALQASDFPDYPGGPTCSAVPEKPVKIEPDPCKEAAALYKKGLYEEVVSVLSGMTEDNQSFENSRITDVNAMALLARSLANLGKMDEAQGFCERVVAADKMNPSFHYLLATVLQERGQTDGAVMSFRRAIYLDQDFVMAYFALGYIAHLRGRFKESKKYFNNVYTLLQGYCREDVLPESDGMIAGRLLEIVASLKDKETTGN